MVKEGGQINQGLDSLPPPTASALLQPPLVKTIPAVTAMVTTLMEASEKEIKTSVINCAYCRLTFLSSFFRMLCKEYRLSSIIYISNNLFVKETLWSGSSNEAGGQGRGQGRQMSAIISVGRCSRVQQSAIMGPILGGQKGKKESWRCVDPRTGQGPQMSP